MASLKPLLLLSLIAAAFLLLTATQAQIQDWDWDWDGDRGEDESEGRRSLLWKHAFYISYGALSANHIPCPPRSGRSYYTPHCRRSRGPVRPYHRGCSSIARCRR